MATMIKNGATKLALDRVPSMARALDCDPAYLLRLTLEQQEGDTAAQAIVEIFGTPVTANELGWLQEIRDASDNGDPRTSDGSAPGALAQTETADYEGRPGRRSQAMKDLRKPTRLAKNVSSQARPLRHQYRKTRSPFGAVTEFSCCFQRL